jgi:hypothetical protein
MSIEVGAKVTWRHGKSKPVQKATRVSNGVTNCTVIELTADGRARIRLPASFGNQDVKVALADLEDAE